MRVWSAALLDTIARRNFLEKKNQAEITFWEDMLNNERWKELI
jgi:hypothetical protein